MIELDLQLHELFLNLFLPNDTAHIALALSRVKYVLIANYYK